MWACRGVPVSVFIAVKKNVAQENLVFRLHGTVLHTATGWFVCRTPLGQNASLTRMDQISLHENRI